jgi:BMFP domain-containing protein YqiC
MSRTPEQNLDGVMAYLKHIEPKREQFERVARYDIDAMQARLDYLEGHIAELEARLDELGP